MTIGKHIPIKIKRLLRKIRKLETENKALKDEIQTIYEKQAGASL